MKDVNAKNEPEDRINNLKTIADELERMPMYQFFLAGRELFHSNFLFWLFHSRCKAILEIFGIPIEKFKKVEREKKNIDLTVTLIDGRRLLIENKFKAVVDSTQLQKYTKNNNTSSTDLHIILSPDALGDFAEENSIASTLEKYTVGEWKSGGRWYHLSYSDLIGELKAVDDVYVKDYVKMVRRTLDFLENVRQADAAGKRIYWFDTDANFKTQDAIAERIKIQDMLQKRRAQKFASELKAKLQTLSNATIDLDVKSGFTRKKPLVEAFVNLPNSDFAIGIQIQEDQFRRCLLVQRSKQKSKAIVSEDEPKLRGRWFRKNKVDPFSGGHFVEHNECALPSSTNNLYQKFGGIFLYQYVKIGLPGLAPQDLLGAIYAEIKLATEIALEWSPASTSN